MAWKGWRGRCYRARRLVATLTWIISRKVGCEAALRAVVFLGAAVVVETIVGLLLGLLGGWGLGIGRAATGKMMATAVTGVRE